MEYLFWLLFSVIYLLWMLLIAHYTEQEKSGD